MLLRTLLCRQKTECPPASSERSFYVDTPSGLVDQDICRISPIPEPAHEAAGPAAEQEEGLLCTEPAGSRRPPGGKLPPAPRILFQLRPASQFLLTQLIANAPLH